jgi:hypothetical protein
VAVAGIEISIEAVRRCIWCGVVKPPSAFAFRSKRRGTRQSHCRSCHAAYRRAHYLRNRSDYITREVDRTRTRRSENRRLLRDYLRSHPCIDCGETDIVTLQFDHRDRSTKRQEVALLVVGKPWSVVATEIAKCDVRCANCHRRRTAAQLGWRRGDAPRITTESLPIIESLLADESTRRCTGCGELMSLDAFAFRDRARGLRRTRCRICMRRYARDHYQRNRRRYADKDWGRKRCPRKALNLEVDDYLRRHPCIDCGEANPLVLDFDHRDGVEKLETIAYLRTKGDRERLLTEIAKCDVRCSNCHSRRTAKQFGWSKMLTE